MATPFTFRKELVDYCKLLYDRGMLSGSEGNISVRLDDDRVLITPAGMTKGRMSPEDMVIIDLRGKHLQGMKKASSEYLMHLFVYQNRPDIKSVVHSHAPYSTAYAVAGVELSYDILPEVVVFVGKIPLTDYAPPGTDSLPKSLEPHIENCNAFLLRNHGLLTVGRSLEEAYNRHETVEHYAKIVHLARQLGNINAIPSDDFKRLEKMRQKLDLAWDKKSE